MVIGQRIAMRQARVVKERLSAMYGDQVEINGHELRPFPRPQRLIELPAVQGLSDVKVQRLRDLGRAAMDGRLDTARLRSIPEAQALTGLQELPGVGPWTASGILLRGCGVADALPMGDDISRAAVQWAYGLEELPDDASWSQIAESWRPFRMWATVPLHRALAARSGDHPQLPTGRAPSRPSRPSRPRGPAQTA